MVTRRQFFISSCGVIGAISVPLRMAFGSPIDDERPAPALSDLIKDPLLLRWLYRFPVTSAYDESGAAEDNRERYKAIGFQRQGAEWIVHGLAANRPEWVRLGWRILDFGLARQTPAGDFASEEPYLSTAQFIESLARSCLLDPTGATKVRIDGLTRAVRWHMSPLAESAGLPLNLQYTARLYDFAAGYGQAAAVTGNVVFGDRAEYWARRAVARQRPDGSNPEKGGYDVSYQMVAILLAVRYLTVCKNPALRESLRRMIRRGVGWELTRQKSNGEIDAIGSTRVGVERYKIGFKSINYNEVFQALIYASLALSEPQWQAAAARLMEFQNKKN